MVALIPADAAAIGLGAFFGALARYQVGRAATEWIASDPNRLGKFAGWHTAGINIGGSFLLGGIAASPMSPSTTTTIVSNLAPKQRQAFVGLTPRAKLMFGVGFCGSYTTFSTYSVDIATWLSKGQTGKAIAYIATNNIGGIVAAGAGMMLVRKYFGR